jgi:hypothetical protein
MRVRDETHSLHRDGHTGVPNGENLRREASPKWNQ